MRLKDGLILRKVAGQYVVVPTGKRVQEIPNMVYISSSAAYLWDFMKEQEFTKEFLVGKIMEYYTGVTEDVAAADIDKFLKVLKDNNVLEPEPGEPGLLSGCVRVKLMGPIPENLLKE